MHRDTIRTFALTSAALVCFAANSLLCRAALRSRSIDAASFTAIRITSGALLLGVVSMIGRPRAPVHQHGTAASRPGLPWKDAVRVAAPFSTPVSQHGGFLDRGSQSSSLPGIVRTGSWISALALT